MLFHTNITVLYIEVSNEQELAPSPSGLYGTGKGKGKRQRGGTASTREKEGKEGQLKG